MSDDARRRLFIATRLRAAREQVGLSQGQVAKLMDMHRPTVSQIEAGDRRVSADELAAFSRHYKVSMSWLVKASDPDQEPLDPQLELAARELSRLRPDDLDRVIRLLQTIKSKDARA